MKHIFLFLSCIVLFTTVSRAQVVENVSFTPSKDYTRNMDDLSSSQQHVYYRMTRKYTLSSMMDMLDHSRYIHFFAKGFGISDKSARNIMNGALAMIFPLKRHSDIDAIVYNYISADVDGNPITLSAKLYLPSEAVTSKQKLKGVVLAQRPTITKASEAPSEAEQIESMSAFMGYAVVVIDGLGFGVDSGNPQTFINTGLIGRHNIDGIRAAKQIIADWKIPCEDYLVNSGYSQGGTNVIATQKYACEHPEAGIVFDLTVAGGGAYDFKLCYDSYLTNEYPEAGRFIILSAISFNETEQLGIDYADVFKEPLLSNYQDWILSKKYDIYEIMDFMGNPTSVSEYLTPEFINGTSPALQKFLDAMQLQDLTVGMTIPDRTQMYVMHSTADDFVPFENFTRLQKSVKGENVHFISDDYGGHVKSSLVLYRVFLKHLK